MKQNDNATSLSNAFLKQNTPNPVSGNSIISYYVPDNASNSQIRITDAKGSLLKTLMVSTGIGQVTIRKGDLPAGTYNYTLYINNKTIDTKQMVLVK
jgi:hypothetical protein